MPRVRFAGDGSRLDQVGVGRRVDARLDLGDVRGRSLRFETEAPVNDILVETNVGGWIFVQAKTSLTPSSTASSELGRVADQIVRQYHACAQGSGERGWDRPLDLSRDRILVAVGRTTAATFANHLASALSAIQAHSAAPLPSNQQAALTGFTERLREAWSAFTGVAPTDGKLETILGFVRIGKFDFQGADREVAIEALRSLLRDEDRAETGFTVLAEECQRLMKTRLEADALALRRVLEQRGLTLRPAPSSQIDIAVLQAYSEDTQTELG